MLDVTGRPSAGQAPPMESDEAAHVLPVTGAPWPAEGSGRMDRVAIHGISATGHHGWLPEERVSGQRFVVDVDLGVDVRQAAASDDLFDTVDYAAVSEDVAAILSGPPVRLIERLAEDIATACLQRSGVREVVVRVHKPQAPIAVPFDDVTVTIHRSRP